MRTSCSIPTQLFPFRALITGLLVAIAVAGCQLFQAREEAEPPPEQRPTVVADEETGVAGPTLADAIEFLQNGEFKAAGELLEALARDEENAVAARLLDQLRQPPESLLGEDYREITVQAGDSLSGLAARHAGDSLLFVALARLNDIEQPRYLQPGTTLKVPALDQHRQRNEESLESAVEGMMEQGRSDQAYSLLLSAARADSLGAAGIERMIAAATSVAGRAIDQGRLDDAGRVLDSVAVWESQAADTAALQRERHRLESRRARQRAAAAREAGERETEREHLLDAVAADPQYEEAREALSEVNSHLVGRYHERALRAWRDQEVREAAKLWQRVVEIDPDFEPARVYLERAHRLLERLEDL